MKDIKNYTLEGLQEILERDGLPKYLAKQVFNWVYTKKAEDFSLMSNISKENRNFLKNNFCLSGLKLIKRQESSDKTEKFLFSLEDSNSIETVFIPGERRGTLCLSTQVGCKFKCSFCASGQKGFKRNLTPSEIINQYLESLKLIKPKKITNFVFMGIGEPLDNFENTIKAIKILSDKEGLGFGRRKISLSTCGLVSEIEELARLKLGIKLSISLHAASDEARSKIMPINKKYPISKLMAAVKKYNDLEGYPVTFEYVIIKDTNSTLLDAGKLAKLLKGIKAKVNLIAYNGLCDEKIPSQEEVSVFRSALKKNGVFASLRNPRGRDISAACGQLKGSF